MSDSLTTQVYLGPGGGKDLEQEAAKSETDPPFLVGLLVRDGLRRLRCGQMRIVNPVQRAATGGRAPEPAPLPLDIGGMLTGAEALQLDALALRNGVAPEVLAAGAVKQLLKQERRAHKKFRLRLPKTLKKRLEKEAEALGCGAGELVALLLSWDAGRSQATVAGW